MKTDEIAVNLWLSPLHINFLQVAIDDLIDVQRSVIIDAANQSNGLEVETLYLAIQRLEAGLNLKQTFEEIDS